MNSSKTSLSQLFKWAFAIVLIGMSILLCYQIYQSLLGVTTWSSWTGFGEYTDPKGEFQRAKTLWDWLELLIVPTALAMLALWFSNQSKEQEQNAANARAKIEREIEQERFRNETVQNYIEKIAELFSDTNFENPEKNIKSITITRAYTLLTLRSLDSNRKSLLLQFLYEMNFINKDNTLLSLKDADFSEMTIGKYDRSSSFGYNIIYKFDKLITQRNTGPVPSQIQLNGINLSGTNLTKVSLSDVNLCQADLSKSNLSRSKIGETDMQESDLSESFMEQVRFYSVNLNRANLIRVDLSNADLSGCSLCGANLSEAKLRHSKLAGIDFTGANLTDCSLKDADLANADFTNAILINVDYSLSQLEKVKSLKGAIMSDGKKFEDSEFARILFKEKK